MFSRAQTADCFSHLIRNCRDHLKKIKSGRQGFHDNQALALQSALTRALYDVALRKLRSTSPDAADWFDGIDHAKVYKRICTDQDMYRRNNRTRS